MPQYLDLVNQHCVIVANGSFLCKEIIQEACLDKVIIALDGAANKLQALDLSPSIILGDFDSVDADLFGIQKTFFEITENDQPYYSSKNYYIVPAKDQKLTDLSKAILFCDQHSVASITLICATGGRMDHHEGAIRSLRSHYRSNRPIVLHTDIQSLQYDKDKTMKITGEPGDKVGILAYPQGSITTQGLVYEAKNYELNFGFNENICNELKLNHAEIQIQGEALVVMPPLLKSQRHFASLNEDRKLQILLRDTSKLKQG